MLARSTLLKTPWRKSVGGLLLVLLLSGAVPARAEEPGLPEDAKRLATEGLAKILGALNLLLHTIPQYAAPEVLPNGDIIIRRLHPEDTPAPDKPGDQGDEPGDGTET